MTKADLSVLDEDIVTGPASSTDGDLAVFNGTTGKVLKLGTSLTEAQKSKIRGNIGVDALVGFRNKLINGDFVIWQRGTSQTATGYGSDDRWSNDSSGTTKTHTQQTFTLGQTDVPGNPKYYSRTVVVTSSGASNFCYKLQKIEDVKTLVGKTVTVSFWAKADAAKNIALELVQNFGVGGSPSSQVSIPAAAKTLLSTVWAKYTVTFSVPSISGKTLGTTGDFLGLLFWMDAGSSLNARTNTLGQQSGTFELSHISLVEGDATAEADPFSPRHIQQEIALCRRYYEKSYNLDVAPGTAAATSGAVFVYGATDNASGIGVSLSFKETKRVVPTMTYYTRIAGTAGSWDAAFSGGSSFYTTTSGGTVGTSTSMAYVSTSFGNYTVANASGHWTADAEL